MIEYKYIKSGNAYLPMYRQVKFSEEWKYFNKKTLMNVSGEENSLLLKLCKSLAELCQSTKTRYGKFGVTIPAQYLIKFKEEEEIIYFQEEYLVCAFLGGAKSFFSQEEKIFE